MPMRDTMTISGLPVEVMTYGAGKPLLYLHGGEGPDVPTDRHLREVARSFRVIAPWHPGFGRLERPKDLREVSDLVYLYLELVRALALHDAVLFGSSFGGWIACEMAIRDHSAFSHLVLAGPLGIKVRDREARDIADVFAMDDAGFGELAFADPTKAKRDLDTLDDQDLAAHFRAHESLALYAWRPYMHNPRLKRWLHRIRLPTLLLAGRQDRVVFDGYYQAFSGLIPGSRVVEVDAAGHFPLIEQPEEVARMIQRFCGNAAPAATDAG